MFDFALNKRLFFPIIVSLLGAGFILFGAEKIYLEVQRLNSPLDRVVVEGEHLKEGSAENEEGLGPTIERGFLPVLSPSDGGESTFAPEIEEVGSSADLNAFVRVPLSEGGGLNDKPTQIIKPIMEPKRLVIPALEVDASIVPVSPWPVEFLGETYEQWLAPRSGELGWHESSAKLGRSGNTVINGHSSGYGDTFQDLEKLENGDVIQVYAGDIRYSFVVANTLVLKERWEPIEVRMENARWISGSEDERLTLITCWPGGSNTHRVVVVATPMGVELPEKFPFPGELELFYIQ